MLIKSIKIFSKLIALLISITGIYSCKDDPECLYGTPHADYIFKGTISSENNIPVKNIKVKVSNDISVTDSTYSDDLGNYEIQVNEELNNKWIISAVDIDSSENGEFQNTDSVIVLDNSEYSDDNKVEKTVNFILKEKK